MNQTPKSLHRELLPEYSTTSLLDSVQPRESHQPWCSSLGEYEPSSVRNAFFLQLCVYIMVYFSLFRLSMWGLSIRKHCWQEWNWKYAGKYEWKQKPSLWSSPIFISILQQSCNTIRGCGPTCKAALEEETWRERERHKQPNGRNKRFTL